MTDPKAIEAIRPSLRNLLVEFCERERARLMQPKGGQHVGVNAIISPSVLQHLEWMLRNSADGVELDTRMGEAMRLHHNVELTGPNEPENDYTLTFSDGTVRHILIGQVRKLAEEVAALLASLKETGR